MSIDSSGRLLVGTSTAFDTTSESKLQVANFGGVYLGMGNSDDTVVTDDNIGLLRFHSYGGGVWEESARISAIADANQGSGDKPSRLVFSTTADGASSPTERLHIKSNTEVQWRNVTELFNTTDNGCVLGKAGNRWSAVWAANGTIQTSDQRAKVNIADAQLGSDFVKSLRPVSYRWIEGGKKHTGEYDENGDCIYETLPGTRTHWGFIAQEVKAVVDAAGVDFGGWVLTDKNDPDSQQALRYDQFIAPLTKALQETMAELEALKAEVAALKAS
jgi:hypothetical protein